MFKPDYQNLVDAAFNRVPARIPLYDHNVSASIIARIINKPELPQLYFGTPAEVDSYFKYYNNFFLQMEYDTVTYEYCVTRILPNGGALSHAAEGAIQDRQSFEAYPFDKLEELYFAKADVYFSALKANMPEGMLAVGGVGNGVFEVVQDLVGYENLCIMLYDDYELVQDLFKKVGDVLVAIWSRFLKHYGDVYCVLRFGDDLGFNSQTLLPHDKIRELIIPQFKRITDLVHGCGKPFLLHSCGRIFDVMEDLIDTVGIDAKHSNEDNICPFSEWVTRYGKRIGNFGGIDTDVICHDDQVAIRQYVTKVYNDTVGNGGIAYGTGNSVPDYVSLEGYLAMNQTLRELRAKE